MQLRTDQRARLSRTTPAIGHIRRAQEPIHRFKPPILLAIERGEIEGRPWQLWCHHHGPPPEIGVCAKVREMSRRPCGEYCQHDHTEAESHHCTAIEVCPLIETMFVAAQTFAVCVPVPTHRQLHTLPVTTFTIGK